MPSVLSFAGVTQSVQRLGCGLDDRDSIPGRAMMGTFLFATASRLALGVHPISYPMGTGGSFHWSKAVGEWSWLLTSI